MEPVITILALGAIGGLIATANWYIENRDKDETLAKVTVARNIVLGAMGAIGAVATTSPDAFPTEITPMIALLAFSAGGMFEFVMQKGSKNILGRG